MGRSSSLWHVDSQRVGMAGTATSRSPSRWTSGYSRSAPFRSKPPSPNYLDKLLNEYKKKSKQDTCQFIIRTFHSWPAALMAIRQRLRDEDVQRLKEEHRERNAKRCRRLKEKSQSKRTKAEAGEEESGCEASGHAMIVETSKAETLEGQHTEVEVEEPSPKR